MRNILIAGGGKIGRLMATMLVNSNRYAVWLVDNQIIQLELKSKNFHFEQCDITDESIFLSLAKKHKFEAVISCLPYFCNIPIAKAAKAAGMHYFDLTEDVKITEAVRELAKGSDKAFVPQCGLAPGFINIAAHSLMQTFDSLENVKLRVGALPLFPNNALQYALNWSTEGLINEYGNMCTAVVAGQVQQVLPLEGRETIKIDGLIYEAFNTSGGIGSMAETYASKVKNLDYKSIRYPGHCKLVRFLLNDLDLNNDRDTLKRILEHSLPRTPQDVVIIYASVKGFKKNELVEETYVNKVYPAQIGDRAYSAIQHTTVCGALSVMEQVFATGKKGYIKQEEFTIEDIVASEFGGCYIQGGDNA